MQRVLTRTAIQRVVASATRQHVGQGAADDRIGLRRTDDVFHILNHERPTKAGRVVVGARRQIDLEAEGRGTADIQRVDAAVAKDIIGNVSAGDLEGVIARAAMAGVLVKPTVQRVVAIAAVQNVDARFAADRVVAAAACQVVVTAVAGDDVVEIRPDHVFNIHQGVGAIDPEIVGQELIVGGRKVHVEGDAGIGPAAQVQRVGAGAAIGVGAEITAGVQESIVAFVAIKVIGAGAAVQRVVAGAAVQRVLTRTAIQRVVASATQQRVDAAACVKRVVAGAAVQRVVAAVADDGVVAGIARQRVGDVVAGDQLVAGTADHILDDRANREGQVADQPGNARDRAGGGRGKRFRNVDHRVVGKARQIQRVDPAAIDDTDRVGVKQVVKRRIGGVGIAKQRLARVVVVIPGAVEPPGGVAGGAAIGNAVALRTVKPVQRQPVHRHRTDQPRIGLAVVIVLRPVGHHGLLPGVVHPIGVVIGRVAGTGVVRPLVAKAQRVPDLVQISLEHIVTNRAGDAALPVAGNLDIAVIDRAAGRDVVKVGVGFARIVVEKEQIDDGGVGRGGLDKVDAKDVLIDVQGIADHPQAGRRSAICIHPGKAGHVVVDHAVLGVDAAVGKVEEGRVHRRPELVPEIVAARAGIAFVEVSPQRRQRCRWRWREKVACHCGGSTRLRPGIGYHDNVRQGCATGRGFETACHGRAKRFIQRADAIGDAGFEILAQSLVGVRSRFRVVVTKAVIEPESPGAVINTGKTVVQVPHAGRVRVKRGQYGVLQLPLRLRGQHRIGWPCHFHFLRSNSVSGAVAPDHPAGVGAVPWARCFGFSSAGCVPLRPPAPCRGSLW